MGKQYTGRKRAKNNTYKLGIEYTDSELTDMSQKPLRASASAPREARASLVVSRAEGGIHKVRDKATNKVVATLSLRRERWCFKLRPGIPGADDKFHLVDSKSRKYALLAIAREIGGFKVEVPA